MAADAFNLLLGAFALLQINISARYNALHDLESALNLMVAMCDGAQYAPTAAARAAGRRRIPTPQWLLGKLRQIGRSSMEQRSREMLESTVQSLRNEGMLRKPVTVALDKTLFPFYGKHACMLGRIYSKFTKGTKVFEAYATAQCVDMKCRVQLAARVVERGVFLDEIVRNLLEDLDRNRIKVRRLLVDREFFNVSVINLLNELGVAYIMPAVKTLGVSGCVREHAGGKRKPVSKCTIKSKDGTKAEFTLVILKKKHPKKDEDKYLVFATSLPCTSVAAALRDIPKEYKMRWGIETGYRDIKRIRPMTTSTSLSVRVAYFFFALAMYNAWIMSKYWAQREGLRGSRLIILICRIAYGSRIGVPRDRGKPA